MKDGDRLDLLIAAVIAVLVVAAVVLANLFLT